MYSSFLHPTIMHGYNYVFVIDYSDFDVIVIVFE